VHAEKLRQALKEERQRRHACEKEAKRLRSEYQKLKDGTALRTVASIKVAPRWRNPFKQRHGGLEDIEEERDGASVLDCESSLSEAGSDGGRVGSRELVPLPDVGQHPDVVWDHATKKRFSMWLKVASAGLVLFLLIVIAVFVLPVPVHQPEFVAMPRLISVQGNSFSVSVEMDMKGSLHYVVVPAALFQAALDSDVRTLTAWAVADASLPRRNSALAQVRCLWLISMCACSRYDDGAVCRGKCPACWCPCHHKACRRQLC
jgi:hypothetical protein